MVTVERAINAISINGNETLLTEEGNTMKFDDKESAIRFLKDNGFDNLTDEEVEDNFFFIYENSYDN